MLLKGYEAATINASPPRLVGKVLVRISLKNILGVILLQCVLRCIYNLVDPPEGRDKRAGLLIIKPQVEIVLYFCAMPRLKMRISSSEPLCPAKFTTRKVRRKNILCLKRLCKSQS